MPTHNETHRCPEVKPGPMQPKGTLENGILGPKWTVWANAARVSLGHMITK